MAKKLFKLVMSASTTTNAVPTVFRYFYQATAAISTTSFFILKSKFVKDNGNAVTAALQTRTTNNGYYLLFVNGELQQSGIYTVGAAGSGLTLAATAAITIPASGVVSLTTTNFAPSSTTTITS